MPVYEIEHTCSLTPDEKSALATAITDIHSRLFTTPSIFVNVRFVDIQGQDYYVGGKKTQVNRILAHVRPGGGRSTADFNKLTEDIKTAWDHATYDTRAPRELRAVFILGTIIAGSEAGFLLPPAGGDKAWLKENVNAFQGRADAGDRDFQGLMEELETRDDLKGILESS